MVIPRSSKAFDRASNVLNTAIGALVTLLTWEYVSPWVAWGYMLGLFIVSGLHALYGLGLKRGERG